MRKRVLKKILCMALSVVMLSGGVMVEAAPVQKKQLEKSIKTNNAILKDKVETQKKQRSIQNNPDVSRKANLIYDLASFNKVISNRDDEINYTNWIVGAGNDQHPLVIRISMPKTGTLYVKFSNQYQDGNSRTLGIHLYKGWATSGKAIVENPSVSKGVLYASNLTRGDYTIVVTVPDSNIGVTGIYPYCVTSENIGMSTKIRMVIGTGKTIYQNFSIKGRRKVWIDSDLAKNGYIEKKSGNKWNKVSDNNYFYSKGKNAERAYYALSTGTYRFAMKPNKGDIVQYNYGSKTYSTAYATKKSKAKQIKRKKSVTNVLTASDKNKTTHYYKIKLTKKSNIKIDSLVYQNGGKMTLTLYGNGIRTNTLTLKGNKRGSWTGTNLKKGTYYIKVTKCTKTTSGTYTIKYTK